MTPREQDPFTFRPQVSNQEPTATDEPLTQKYRRGQLEEIVHEADQRAEDAGVVEKPAAQKRRAPRFFPPGDPVAAAQAGAEKPTEMIRPGSVFKKSTAFQEVVELPGAAAANRAREEAVAKQQAEDEEKPRRLAEEVISGMALLFVHVAAKEPDNISDTLSGSAIQLNKHLTEYHYLLKSSPDAATLYQNLSVGLRKMYDADESIRHDPNYAVIYYFIEDGKKLL